MVLITVSGHIIKVSELLRHVSSLLKELIRRLKTMVHKKFQKSKSIIPFPCPFLAKPHPYLFYFCLSWDRSTINKQRYGYDRKDTWKRSMSSLSKDEMRRDGSLTLMICPYTVIKTVFMHSCVLQYLFVYKLHPKI